MSKVVKRLKDRPMGHIVEHENGNFYYVDSAYTFDHGLETMVFYCEPDGDKHKVDWGELHMRLHGTYTEMENYHFWLIDNLEKVDLS